MFRLRRFDQQRHGVRDIRGVDPVLDARTRQNSFALLANGGRDLRLWTERVAYPGRPFPSPEDAAQSHTDDIEAPERSQTRGNSLGSKFGDGIERLGIAGRLLIEQGVLRARSAIGRAGLTG
jgi:hypothetical protein